MGRNSCFLRCFQKSVSPSLWILILASVFATLLEFLPFDQGRHSKCSLCVKFSFMKSDCIADDRAQELCKSRGGRQREREYNNSPSIILIRLTQFRVTAYHVRIKPFVSHSSTLQQSARSRGPAALRPPPFYRQMR